MDETLGLIRQHDIRAAASNHVEVTGTSQPLNTLFRHLRPLVSKRSSAWSTPSPSCCSSAKRVWTTSPTQLCSVADVQDLGARVRYVVDPDAGKTSGFQAALGEAATLKIFMKDGRVLSTRTEPAKGDPRNPMRYEEVADKFRGNAAFAKWPRQKAGVDHHARAVARTRAEHGPADRGGHRVGFGGEEPLYGPSPLPPITLAEASRRANFPMR